MPHEKSQVAGGSGASVASGYQFGSFQLVPARQQLVESGKPVRLGSRALELLTLLVERAGTVVDKASLIQRAWPDTVVEEINLRVQIAALRRALGDADLNSRFVATVPGRGYSFVSPVSTLTTANVPEATVEPTENHLPRRSGRVFGRQNAVAAMVEQLPHRRFITIVGPGGMGKTTLALAVAERSLDRRPDGAFFVDLASVHGPDEVPAAIAAALRLGLTGPQVLKRIAEAVAGRAMLVVLDNCEHLATAAAAAAETLLHSSSNLWVLATSREPLRAEGEWLHRVQALGLPEPGAVGETVGAAEALQWPAVQLFVDRATASLESYVLTDEDAPVVVDLCRELDGMPLAIELAAARVDTLGLNGLASHIRERLHLLTSGRRTAQPRQRTLRALLDWSYALLTEQSQAVLRRLAVFQGTFTLEEAAQVVADESLNESAAKGEVVALAERSLLSFDTSGDVVRYRMLELTRAYADELLSASADSSRLGKRHAQLLLKHYLNSVERWDELPRSEWLAQHGRHTDDLRSALDWAFAPDGDAELGVQLVVAVAPLAFELAVLHDFGTRVEQALRTLDLLPGDHREEAARLHTALGSLQNQLLGPGPEMSQSYKRAYELTPHRDSAKAMSAPSIGLWAQAYASGEFDQALDWAAGLEALADAEQDRAALLIARRMLAQTYHMRGDYARSRELANQVLQHSHGRFPLAYGPSQTSIQVTMRIVLARTDWIEGRADDAIERVNEALEHAAAEHVFGEFLVLVMAACPIALWRGDNDSAHALVRRLRALLQRYPSPYWQTWTDGFEFALGVKHIELPPYDALRYDTFVTLQPGLFHTKTLARAESALVGWCAPEVLRVHALRVVAGDRVLAEATLVRAMELARGQGALAWELRCATSLAKLWKRPTKVRALLRPLLQRFQQGLQTRDLSEAKKLVEVGA